MVIMKKAKYVFSAMLITTYICFNSVLVLALGTSDVSSKEMELLQLSKQVSDLRHYVIGANNDKDNMKKVLEKAPQLADTLLAISDKDLSKLYQVMKHHLVSYSYMMAATVNGTGEEESLVYCQHSLEEAQITNQLIAKIKQMEETGEISSQQVHWIDNYIENNAKYATAICMAIRVRYGDETVTTTQAIDALDDIPASYKKKYPPAKNPHLQWLQKSIEKNDS